MGARIGNGAYIACDCEFWFEDPRLLSIGSGTWVDKNCRFGEMMPNKYEIAIGNNVRLFDGLRFGAYAGPIKIGDRSRIGFFSVFRGPAFLGKASLISHHVVIVGGGHQFDKMDSLFVDQGVEIGPVNIGDSAWIGSNVTIVPGVTIGEHAVIGANSVVTKDIPSYCIAAGCPARVIKRYDFEKKEWVKVNDKSRET
jgi:acetyltransferase-like isoleucine patch superfamily enzyme